MGLDPFRHQGRRQPVLFRQHLVRRGRSERFDADDKFVIPGQLMPQGPAAGLDRDLDCIVSQDRILVILGLV